METHAHHLHKAPGKNFWHYFFEFLMLFLAVFCGFLAENYREHRVEKEKANQYIESFYEDLKTDTSAISVVIKNNYDKLEGLANIFSCYDTVSKNMKATSCMLELLKNSSWFYQFALTDRTLRQLENAGGFRLLHKEDADSILQYQKTFINYQGLESTLYQVTQDKLRDIYNKLVHFNTTSKMYKQPVEDLNDFAGDLSGVSVTIDAQNLLNEYFNELFLYNKVVVAALQRLNDLKKNQIRLIGYFKNKYHFDQMK
jgi:hypothetical protein